MKIFFSTKTFYKIFLVIFLILICTQNLTAAAWKLSRSFWTEQDEKIYENFVKALGESKHGNLNRFIRDAKANPLYGQEDKHFNLYPDCADLPYLLRAYVAYKLRLPFGYVSKIAGKGGDPRYSYGNHPVEFKDQDYFSSPQKLFSKVLLINSGFYRMKPGVENSDHYPVKIQPESIKPGTIYYDPNGHVAVVYKVRSDGRIKVIDGHPDRTISKPWFGSKFVRGNKKNGGGFKRWRPLRYTSNGKISRASNHNIPDFSAEDQYRQKYSYKGRNGLSYYDYCRARLSKTSVKFDPVNEFRFMMKELYEDIKYRVLAVDICIKKGIDKKTHPGALPWNIYGTSGIWEEFSTPSRDARLKMAFKGFYERTVRMVLDLYKINPQQSLRLASDLLNLYDNLSPALSVSYTDSAGNTRVLDFNEVCQRLFRLSFDPYHSIEYRWGASDKVLALSPDNHTKKKFYDLEQRLRNQLERVYNCHTPLSMGPKQPPQVNVRKWLVNFLEGKISLPVKLASVSNAVKAANSTSAGSKSDLDKIQKKKSVMLVEKEKLEVGKKLELEPEIKPELKPKSEPDEIQVKDFVEDLINLGDNFAVSLLDAKLSPETEIVADKDNFPFP
ncbi:MAG: hypothetical protein ACQETH_06355 [Candidatus Rifleibacteriota bacterium]